MSEQVNSMEVKNEEQVNPNEVKNNANCPAREEKKITLFLNGTKLANKNEAMNNVLAPDDNEANIIIKSMMPVDFIEGTVLVRDGIQWILLSSNDCKDVVNKTKMRYNITVTSGIKVRLINEQITIENLEDVEKVITRNAEVLVPKNTYLKLNVGSESTGLIVSLPNDETFKLHHA